MKSFALFPEMNFDFELQKEIILIGNVLATLLNFLVCFFILLISIHFSNENFIQNNLIKNDN